MKTKKGTQWMPLIHLLQTYKPDSVIGYHLSGCYIAATILLPTLQLAPDMTNIKFGTSGEQPLSRWPSE